MYVGGIFNPNNGNQTTPPGSLDPTEIRKRAAGFINPSSTTSPDTQFGTSDDSGNEWRVKISINPSSKILYWDPSPTGYATVPGLLAPLKFTDGFIFPYVPQITVSHSANYSAVPLTHANYAHYFYESSSVASISKGCNHQTFLVPYVLIRTVVYRIWSLNCGFSSTKKNCKNNGIATVQAVAITV